MFQEVHVRVCNKQDLFLPSTTPFANPCAMPHLLSQGEVCDPPCDVAASPSRSGEMLPMFQNPPASRGASAIGPVSDRGIDDDPFAIMQEARRNNPRFWINKGVEKTRVERYSHLKDAVARDATEEFDDQFIVVEMEPGSPIHPFNQGSPLMLLRGAVQERRRLRTDPDIVESLKKLWTAIPKDQLGNVDKAIYSCLHRKILAWLMPDIGDSRAGEILDGDWRQV